MVGVGLWVNWGISSLSPRQFSQEAARYLGERWVPALSGGKCVELWLWTSEWVRPEGKFSTRAGTLGKSLVKILLV